MCPGRTGARRPGLAASPAGHSLTTAQIAAAVDPAVVDINTNLGEGTGMIATSNGEIITNNHVVEGASTIKVVIDNGGTYKATVVGTDATADVAVLQAERRERSADGEIRQLFDPEIGSVGGGHRQCRAAKASRRRSPPALSRPSDVRSWPATTTGPRVAGRA